MWSQITDPADPKHVRAVVAAARAAAPRCADTVVVAVDGPSGSGKTALAVGVARELDCPVVHLDRIYPGWDGLREGVRVLTEDVLAPLARGDRAAYRTWDWERERWDGLVRVPPTTTLVVEGCGASTGAAGGYAAVRVWLSAPPEERLARGLERDGETYRPHWDRWAAQEHELFGADRTAEHADLVLDTGPVAE